MRGKLIPWLTAIFMAFGPYIFAQTILSNGTGGGAWNLGASWSGGIAPGAGNDVVILAGDVITATTSQPCTNLTVAGTLSFNTNSVTISPSGNLTVTGAFAITGSNANRNLNVAGNLLSASGADGTVGGITMTIGGTTNLQGRVVFNNTTGSKTLSGDVTIADGGALDFSAAVTVVIGGSVTMSGTSSLAGTSSSTGLVVSVNTFAVNAGAVATIGRITLAGVGTTQIDGQLIFNNGNGSKTFLGAVTMNSASIDFTAAPPVSFNSTLTANGTCSVGTASTTTATLTVVSSLSVSAAGSLNVGRLNLNVGGAGTIDGTLQFTSTLGTKSISGNVTASPTGAITFTVAETLDLSADLTTNAGAVLGGGVIAGTINVGGAYTATTGGISSWNTINLFIAGGISAGGTATIKTSGTNQVTAGGDLSVSGSAVLDFGTGATNLGVKGNWSITSGAGDPFVEGASAVTLNGSSGTQSISTTEFGGEHFYKLVINNTSAATPSVVTFQDITVTNSLTFTNGKLAMAGFDLAITGDGATSTDTFTTGSITSSVSGTDITITDPSMNKTVNFNGTTFGDATIGIPFTLTSLSSSFNGSTFYGTASFTKTGTAQDVCNGGNIFYGPVNFTTAIGADRWAMGSSSPDIFYNTTFLHSGTSNWRIARSLGNEFYGTTTFTNNSNAFIYIGRTNNNTDGSAVFHGPVVVNITSSGSFQCSESNASIVNATTFENTIQLNSSGGSTGNIYLGSGGFGSTTLTATGQFIGGSLLGTTTAQLQRVTQNGNTLIQTIIAAGSCTLDLGSNTPGDGVVFNASVSLSAPTLQVRYSTLNGALNGITQTGNGGTNTANGGNTTATGTSTTFSNNGTKAWRLGITAADDFNGDVYFNQNGSGALQPCYANNSAYSGNITTGTANVITFGSGGGRLTFDGTGARTLSGDMSQPPVCTQLTMNGSGSLTLSVPLSVTTDLNFTNGIINTTSTNLLTFNAGSAVSGTPSNASHVDGPVRKVGNTAFTFPTGDGGRYRSIGISTLTTSTTFTAELFVVPQAFGFTWDPTFYTVSGCEYWVLDRNAGTSNANVTLSWNSPDCTGTYVTDLPTLRVSRWTGAIWTSHGNGGTTGNATTGTVIGSAVVTNFNAPFALASTSGLNPLPVEVVDFAARSYGNIVNVTWFTGSELNNDYFAIQRSRDGYVFVELGRLSGKGTTHEKHAYSFQDDGPLPGTSYYRLKQTDFDGTSESAAMATVTRATDENLKLFPNPVKSGATLFANEPNTYEIANQLGQVVLRVEGTGQIITEGLLPGVYIIRNSGGTTRRIVVE